jgi:uncharacterized surface protein with fasciclin (FAS1) repeats
MMNQFRTNTLFRRALVLPAVGLAALAIGIAGCGGDNDQPAAEPVAMAETTDSETMAEPAEETIVETAVDAGEFTTLVSLLEQTGLDETLSQDGPFTVFAPTDEAFAKVPAETLEQLAAQPKQLEAVLLYHVAEGEVEAADVVGMSSVATLNGASAPVEANGDVVRVGGAKVVQADVAASNGVVHVVDAVLIPS